jgi:hypothetical protein
MRYNSRPMKSPFLDLIKQIAEGVVIKEGVRERLGIEPT